MTTLPRVHPVYLHINRTKLDLSSGIPNKTNKWNENKIKDEFIFADKIYIIFVFIAVPLVTSVIFHCELIHSH